MTYRYPDIWREPHTVYRIYGVRGILLYIGISVDPVARLAAHDSSAEWADQFHHLSLDRGYSNRREAFDAENRAIKAEHPVHNTVGSVCHCGRGCGGGQWCGVCSLSFQPRGWSNWPPEHQCPAVPVWAAGTTYIVPDPDLYPDLAAPVLARWWASA